MFAVSCVPTVSLNDTNFVGDSVQRQAECLAMCEALSGTGCELVTGQSVTSVLSITIQRRAVSTPSPERSSHHCDQDVASSVRAFVESFQVWCGNIREHHLSVW